MQGRGRAKIQPPPPFSASEKKILPYACSMWSLDRLQNFFPVTYLHLRSCICCPSNLIIEENGGWATLNLILSGGKAPDPYSSAYESISEILDLPLFLNKDMPPDLETDTQYGRFATFQHIHFILGYDEYMCDSFSTWPGIWISWKYFWFLYMTLPADCFRLVSRAKTVCGQVVLFAIYLLMENLTCQW